MRLDNATIALSARLAATMIGGVVALYLLSDAVTMSLSPADPLSGRARGCYSLLEIWLGRLEPSDTLRVAQLSIAGLGLFALAAYWARIVFAMVRGRHRGQSVA